MLGWVIRQPQGEMFLPSRHCWDTVDSKRKRQVFFLLGSTLAFQIELHTPGRITKELAVIFAHERLDVTSLIAQAKRSAVTWIADCIIRPTQDHLAQGLECGLKILNRPRLPWSTIEDRIADNDPRISFYRITNLVGGMSWGEEHPQRMLSHLKRIAIFHPVVGFRLNPPHAVHDAITATLLGVRASPNAPT